jgi:hypothetical protein
MHALLFIFYSLIGCYALTRIPFFRNSGIRPRVLLFYFGLRVATGCLHNWIAYRYYPKHGDVWRFFNNSLVQRRELFTDFHAFWADNSTLAYLSHNVIEWMHMLLNFLSLDNLYINTLLFSFLSLGGIIALFRFFTSRLEDDPLSACCILVLPSTLFWTSCIHTEGLVYSILGFLFYYLDRLLTRGPSRRPILLCLFLFVLAVFFRPAILISLLPAILFWILAEKKHHNYMIMIAVISAVVITLFSPAILHSLSTRQAEFQLLVGNSRIYLPVLEPSWTSFARVLPTAALNGLFQPLPGSGGQRIYAVFSVELILIWLIIGYALLRLVLRKKPAPDKSVPIHADSIHPRLLHLDAFAISCLIFSLLGMLLIGYIIPFVGSIIRYRSIYLPFLLAPFLHTLRSQRIASILNNWLKKHIVEAPKH